MTGFARSVAALIAVAIAACAFLPWVANVSAWHLHVRSLFAIGEGSGSQYWTSIGAAVTGAALLVLIGAVINARMLIIVAGLLAVAIPSIWIFGNAVSHVAGAVPLARVQIGAFGSAVTGFMALILAAVSHDTTTPSVR